MSENNNDNKLNRALERYGNSTKAVTKKKSDRSGIIILIVITLFVILVKNCSAETSSNSSASSSSSTCKCDYCGKYEDGRVYKVTYLTGFNKDGTIKKETAYVNIGDNCIEKARKSGVYANIE